MTLSSSNIQLLNLVAKRIREVQLLSDFELDEFDKLIGRLLGTEELSTIEELLQETRDVAARLNKLNAFMATDAFPKLPQADKDLQYDQSRAMSHYVQILGKRLGRMGSQFSHS